jgi:hypothetical protein
MSNPLRYTPEKRQELISRNQLSERLVEFGWIPSQPEDLGEDFIVHIYFDGRATGVPFYIQEKSIVNINERRIGDLLPYKLKVKDLIHWERFSHPVVLIVWDIIVKEGRWLILNNEIPNLDKKNPKWRSQGTAFVYLPWKNKTDDKGLISLRHEIGQFLWPIISKGKKLTLTATLNFSNTNDSLSFKESYDFGEDITLPQDVITKITVQEWAKPWFNENFKLIAIKSMPSEPRLFDITVSNLNGKSETIRNIELRKIRSGRDSIVISNDHQNTSLHFKFEVGPELSISLGIMNWGSNAYIARDMLRFLHALANGGSLFLSPLTDLESKPAIFDIPGLKQKITINPEFEKFVDDICFIQEKTRRFFPISIDGFTNENAQLVAELVLIFKSGQTVRTYPNLVADITGDDISNDFLDDCRQKTLISFSNSYDTTEKELFSQKIEIGKRHEEYSGELDMPMTDIEKSIEIYKTENRLPLRFTYMKIIATYPDWSPSS